MNPGSKAWCASLLTMVAWYAAYGLHEFQTSHPVWGAVFVALTFLIALGFVDELEGA